MNQHTIVYRSLHTYNSHPCITQLTNGDWLVAFSHSTLSQPPFIHPPNDPHFINMICRSHDQGRTWQAPRTAPGYDWNGVETPGITQISSGKVLLNQWRFEWQPVEAARCSWARNQKPWFVYNPELLHWQRARSEEDWKRHPLPYARADGGAFVHISMDQGETWEFTVPVEIAPYQGAFSPKGAIELRNGEILLALGSHEHDPLAASFVVRSSDQGFTWQKPVEVARMEGLVFSEPTVVETQSGRLLLMSREETGGYIYQSESTDSGYTWQPARRLPLWGFPCHAIRLRDSRVLIIYGRRKTPYAICAAVSDDDGASWSEEVVIRGNLTDSCEGLNLGYPSVIEYTPGKLFTAYYAEDSEGLPCIQGTFFDL
ncbi:MAG: glycoside hydrolase [Chloroflexi bacterium]|nr:glycoside hydrolase [Chloroflexota bacterium]